MPMRLRRTGEPPSEAEFQQLRHKLGLDRPFVERYVGWLSAATQGDFGESYRTGQPVLSELRARLPAPLTLAVAALAVGPAIAVPLAVVSAATRDTALDHSARTVAPIGVSMPSYWLGYVLILFFAVTLGALPVSGIGGVRHLVLPALTLGLGSAASVARMLRANLRDLVYQRGGFLKAATRSASLLLLLAACSGGSPERLSCRTTAVVLAGWTPITIRT